MFTIEEFHEELMQEIFQRANSFEIMREQAFLEEVENRLIEESDLSENVQFNLISEKMAQFGVKPKAF
ncbi:hypothetical protein IJD44_01460 [bacterium]|nr:hypothetical protein [bacterium]